jgi:hypothetical protein
MVSCGRSSSILNAEGPSSVPAGTRGPSTRRSCKRTLSVKRGGLRSYTAADQRSPDSAWISGSICNTFMGSAEARAHDAAPGGG